MKPSSYSHGHIIPLIGGTAVGTTAALGHEPSWIASWGSIFGSNDSKARQYFSSVPYFELENGQRPSTHADIITCLPPCAGLSHANTTQVGKNPRGCSAPSNEHMVRAAELAMSELSPKVMMVENAPALYSNLGKPFAERINALAQEHDYSMSIVKTSSVTHGIPQHRPRSFFFLWKGKKVPVLNQIRKPYQPFHELVNDAKYGGGSVPVHAGPPPSTDPLWKFIEQKFLSLTKQEILFQIAGHRPWSAWKCIYYSGWLPEAAATITDPKSNRWLNYAMGKKAAGLNILDMSTKLCWDTTCTLMWQTLPKMMHPHHDRWLNTAEALAMMGFPDDYVTKVDISTKESNIICQNVPACTAADWIREAVAALNGEREWIDPRQNTDGSRKILRQSNFGKTGTMTPIWAR